MTTAAPYAAFHAPASARPLRRDPRFGFAPIVPALLQYPMVGEVVAKQSQLIYAIQIAGRVKNARDPAEAREHALRDVLGYCSWFWTTPIVLRLFLHYFAPKDVQKALLLPKAPPKVTQPWNPLQHLAWFNYHVLRNPLSRTDLVPLQSIENRRLDVERLWKTAHAGMDTAQRMKLEEPTRFFFERMKGWRIGAMGLGLAMSLAMLGIVINQINIWLTERAAARRAQVTPPQTPAVTPPPPPQQAPKLA